MALIPLDTARRITQSPLQGVNQRLMQLVNLQRADREAARAERIGNLQAQLLQARIKRTEDQADAKRRAALEKIAKGMREKEEETLRTITQKAGSVLKSFVNKRVSEVYEMMKNNAQKNAVSDYLKTKPAMLESIINGINSSTNNPSDKLVVRGDLSDYPEQVQDEIVLTAIPQLPKDYWKPYFEKVTEKSAKNELMKNMDESEVRDIAFNIAMKLYGGAFNKKQKDKFRKALGTMSKSELIFNFGEKSVVDMIMDAYKHVDASKESNSKTKSKESGEGIEENRKPIGEIIMKHPDMAEVVERKIKQLGPNLTAENQETMIEAIMEKYGTNKDRARDIYRQIFITATNPWTDQSSWTTRPSSDDAATKLSPADVADMIDRERR